MNLDEPMRDARTWDLTGRAGQALTLFALRLVGVGPRELALRSALAVPLHEPRQWSATWEEQLEAGA